MLTRSSSRVRKARLNTSSEQEQTDPEIYEDEGDITLKEELSPKKTPVKAPRKRSAKIPNVLSATAVELEELRFNFKEAIRGSYQSVDQILTPYVNQTKTVLLKLQKGPQNYFHLFEGELLFRLNFMVQTIEPTVSRCNVYTMLVEATHAVAVETQTASKMLQQLVSYCEDLYCAEDTAVRFNICCLVGVILDFWPMNQGDLPSYSALTRKQRDLLYEIIHSRRLDKIAQVRSQAVRACRVIQDSPIGSDFKQAITFGPKDILHQALQDRDAQCRVAAVETLTFDLTLNEHVQALIEIALGDPHMQVRSCALRRLLSLNLNLLKKNQLCDLLQSVLYDTDDMVRKVAKTVLLKGWINQLTADVKKKLKRKSRTLEPSIDFNNESNHGWGAGLLALITKLPWMESPDVVASLIFVAFDLIREEQGVLTVPELFLSLREDQIPPRPIMRYNCNLLVEHEMPGKQLALSCFYWRCMIEYSYTHTSDSDSAERVACLHRLAPTLKELAALAKIIKTIPGSKVFTSDDEELQYLAMTQIAFKEVLISLSFLEEDQCGLDEWRVTLEEALQDFTTKKEVTDIIAQQLVTRIYKDSPMVAFEVFVNTTAQLVDKDINPDATIMNETLTMPGRPQPAGEANEFITAYCLQVTNSILKTGIIKTKDAIVQDKYQNLIYPSIGNPDPTIRNWAVEAMGILGLLDSEIIRENWKMMQKGLVVDCLPTRLLCMTVSCDWAIEVGLRKVDEGLCIQPILDYYEEVVSNERKHSLVLVERGVECACKLLLFHPLHQKTDSWAKLLTAITFKMFDPELAGNVYTKACISQFFPCFVSKRCNQALMVHVFWALMKLLFNEDSTLTDEDIRTCLKMVCEFTKKEMIKSMKEEDKSAPTYHVVMSKSTVRHLMKYRDNKKMYIAAECLLYFEYDVFPTNELLSFFEEVSSAYATLMKQLGDRSKLVTSLKKVGRVVLPFCGKVLGLSNKLS